MLPNNTFPSSCRKRGTQDNMRASLPQEDGDTSRIHSQFPLVKHRISKPLRIITERQPGMARPVATRLSKNHSEPPGSYAQKGTQDRHREPFAEETISEQPAQREATVIGST